MVLLLREGACDIPIRCFFQGGTRPGRRLCRYRTLWWVRFSESDIGQCYRCERLLWRTGAACCCIELYEQAFIYSSVLLLGEDSTLINNECRDNLGYGIADAMGFDLFAFVFFGGAERSQRWLGSSEIF